MEWRLAELGASVKGLQEQLETQVGFVIKLTLLVCGNDGSSSI